MNDYGKTSGQECSPRPKHPAPQPNPIPDDPDQACCASAITTEFPDPPSVPEYPEWPNGCECPTAPTGSSTQCLERLIEEQDAEIEQATAAGDFKKTLQDVLKSATEASKKYNRAKYVELVDRWRDLDRDIVEVIRKLVCAIRCWRCVLECHICPLLYDVHRIQKELYDDDQLSEEIHDLQDKQYWLTRYKAVKEREFYRVTDVMNAWKTPAETIEGALTANGKLIVEVSKMIGTEPGRAVYPVFLKLVPLHLAIAPPAAHGSVTGIDVRYTKLCKVGKCKEGRRKEHEDGDSHADDCCGPNVGELSLRQQLIGPQPYLIDPNDYYKMICCLVDKRWRPARQNLNNAATELAKVTRQIRQRTDKLSAWKKTFDDLAKDAIPRMPDCCDYPRSDDDDDAAE